MSFSDDLNEVVAQLAAKLKAAEAERAALVEWVREKIDDAQNGVALAIASEDALAGQVDGYRAVLARLESTGKEQT